MTDRHQSEIWTVAWGEDVIVCHTSDEPRPPRSRFYGLAQRYGHHWERIRERGLRRMIGAWVIRRCYQLIYWLEKI